MISPTVLNTLHDTQDIPHIYRDIPHGTQDIPHGTHDTPHGTEHPPRYWTPHGTEHPHGTAHTLYRVVCVQIWKMLCIQNYVLTIEMKGL